ncbi:MULTISPECIES: DNA-directed RNA polymerase subunit omega [Desulfosporosinus]|uniref:DNA-directed RNA polymerase subunit omega n=2 Tax=Desulfosporosinus TaxID=79206 RepID=A0A1M5UHP5_9FIRM|nr:MULTISPECIES: DNA-directed RNA polymerase subunit omega [Desulfosporosinus]MDA8223778.1 DNA-directed RNA polymerase subunit omega [Desulfitobacterium hafniense]MCB8814012.1 DNA-directed RNA polymerase subunit omega [Desulfosporosinus sp. SRJS8]MCO1601180.1 DNA-directed RNA polymerase subunit omega [Desulfosporosinus nitroreducens]MCO5385491.1 DNA-directed RNA polymerase subunit omega [Desulfosporosinus sp.]MDO0821684.1 DNA-directed RNA polymerase subunit omega [Desulfosporosinus nitroreduce
MKQPSLDILMSKVDSKYTLVKVVAKRARTIMEEAKHEDLAKGVKPVSISLEEISHSDLNYECTPEESV